MALKLYADGKTVYDSRLEEYKLLGLKTTEGVNKSGTAEFIMPPNHPAYNRFVSLRTVVTLYENEALRFRGRAIYPADDWLNCRTITCEGERGFFRDSVMRPYLFQGTPAEIFAQALELHNAQVDDFKRFTLGEVTVTDPNDYIRMESESAMKTADFLEKLVERCGGFITFNDNGNGGRAANWLAEIGTRSQQSIEFGENLLDFARSGQTTDLATAIRPYGAKLEETGKRVTIESVTEDGADWIKDDDAVALRGIIMATETWDDVTEPKNLLTKAKQWLGEHRLSITSLQLTAADMSKLDRNIGSYHVGDLVHVLSVPHGVDDYFQLTERSTDWLEPAGDKVTLGKSQSSLVGMDVAGDRQSASKLDKVNQQAIKDIKNLAQQVTNLDTKVEGVDGLYFYIKYSAYEDGHIMTDTPQADTQYMGTCSAKLKQDVAPTDYREYTWCKIKGETGKGIKSTSSTYQAGSSGTTEPTETWLPSVPTVAAGQYLWTRTVITYTDGETSTSYSVGRMGIDGNNGTPGKNGVDGKTQYLHIKYTDDGKTFTANNGETLGAWIGTKVDFIEADSTTFSDYTWKKFTEDVDVGSRNLLVNTHYFQEASPIVLSSASKDNCVTQFDGFTLYTPNAIDPETELTLQACTDAAWSSYHGYQDANSKKVVSMWLYWFDTLEKAQTASSYVNATLYPADGTSTGRFFWTFKAPAATGTVSKWYACVRLNSYSDGSEVVSHNVWNIKLERGNVPTDWTPSPEDVNGKINDVHEVLTKTITEQKTEITNTCNQIILSALESYVETGNYSEFKTTVESQLSVLADQISMNFTTTSESITTVDGDVKTKFEQLYKYISFTGENGITIGTGENSITLKLDVDGIVFSKNGVAFGSWDGVDFYTGNIVVQVNERAQLGNFAFVPRSDGSLMFLKVGD